jgi:hypothetical protein
MVQLVEVVEVALVEMDLVEREQLVVVVAVGMEKRWLVDLVEKQLL